MKIARILGTFYGITGAAAYGTNPLFAMYMLKAGIGVSSILFYRYFLGVILFGLWLKFYKKVSLSITIKELLISALLGFLFAMSSITLFSSYKYIAVGIASTILFVYPIIVAVLMNLFFKEKINKPTVFAIILTTIGTFLLYKGDSSQNLNLTGVILVLISALMYSLYMVCVKKNHIARKINSEKLSFYVILFGLFVFVINLKFCTQLQIVTSPFLWICIVGLAIFPTIISIEFTNLAIKFIGSTKTAILGALEPITAIIFGVVLFSEILTLRIICGIILIILGVFLVVLNKKK